VKAQRRHGATVTDDGLRVVGEQGASGKLAKWLAQREDDGRHRSTAAGSLRKERSRMELYPAMWSTARDATRCQRRRAMQQSSWPARVAMDEPDDSRRWQAEGWVEESGVEKRVRCHA
jgi:hypothetical protein